jgi:hypothetical protein
MSALTHFGARVVESPALPIPASPRDQAVRIVRTGLADILAWLGEEVGEVGKPVHVVAARDCLLVSGEAMASLRREIVQRVPLFAEVGR